jgi:hypothetical protein
LPNRSLQQKRIGSRAGTRACGQFGRALCSFICGCIRGARRAVGSFICKIGLFETTARKSGANRVGYARGRLTTSAAALSADAFSV